MVKKSVIILVVALILISTNIYGADIVYRIIHGDQYTLILGTVEQTDENWIVVEIERNLNGKDVGGKIKIFANQKREIEPKFYWYEPKEGDYIVISIDKKLSRYVLKFGVFKVSSLDYRTLSIEKGLSSPNNAMLQYYINSGCKENSFYFEKGKVFVRKSDGSETEIYPEAMDSFENKINYYESIDKPETLSLNLLVKSKSLRVVVVALSNIILVIIVILYFKKRKHNSR